MPNGHKISNKQSINNILTPSFYIYLSFLERTFSKSNCTPAVVYYYEVKGMGEGELRGVVSVAEVSKEIVDKILVSWRRV